MNTFSTFAVRLRWTLKLVAQNLLTWQGRGDFLRAYRDRKRLRSRTYPIRLVRGTIFVDGQTAVIDLRVFGQVFLDEVYAGLLLEDSVVIDIGAHKGYFAAYALLRGAKAVICYEPESANFSALSRFAQASAPQGHLIELHNEAGGEDGEAELYISKDSWLHTTIARKDLEYLKTVKVCSRSLSSILAASRQRFPEDPIILKIDAEGAECPLLLQASIEALAAVREVIFEFHSFSPCLFQDIANKLRSVGFAYVRFVKEAELHHFRIESPPSSNKNAPSQL
jgi:FkbM family methyltransferase